MPAEVVRALNAFRAHSEPRDGLDDNPFKLGCFFDRPAPESEIGAAWPHGALPAELVAAWRTSREYRLFVDVGYGQWGLVLLSPMDAARRTADERARRPSAYRKDDVVIGEFLGDQELLVLAPSEADRGHVLVALPLDDRPDWHAVASDLVEFLERYLRAFGNKYWEVNAG